MIDSISLFGKDISLYYAFWLIGALSVIIGGCFLGKRYGFSASRGVLHVTGAVAMGYVLLWLTSWVFNGGKMGGLNFVRLVIFLPAAIYLLSKIFKDSFENVADFLAPLVAIYHGVTHIGCIFEGCCNGYPSAWGLYSNAVGVVCFPIQPIEAASSIFVGVVLLLMMKKNIQKGKLYAWYLALFGFTRFIWEFFRDNEKVWMGISELALHALSAFIIGAVALVILNSRSKRGKNHEQK